VERETKIFTVFVRDGERKAKNNTSETKGYERDKRKGVKSHGKVSGLRHRSGGMDRNDQKPVRQARRKVTESVIKPRRDGPSRADSGIERLKTPLGCLWHERRFQKNGFSRLRLRLFC